MQVKVTRLKFIQYNLIDCKLLVKFKIACEIQNCL